MKALEKLKEFGTVGLFDERLPTMNDIVQVESTLGVTFPDSYKEYLLKYSNIFLGGYELYKPFSDGSYLDMLQGISEAREYNDIAENLIPFLYDNGDYFCFNTKNNSPDYQVVYWSHNGTTDEKWDNFLDWVEKCWVGEYLKSNDT